MTEGATLSATIRTAGPSFPALPRARPETAGAPSGGNRAVPNDTAASRLDPALSRRTPLLNGQNQLAAQEAGIGTETPVNDPVNPAGGGPRENGGENGGKGNGFDPSNPDNLTDAERQKVRDLQARDREVRAHEQAHKTAGGAHAGSPTFNTEQGPDGKTYAVSGEVKIDTSPVPNNPEATIRKLEQVKRAALAPADPSAQDRAVAAAAEATIEQARREKQQEAAKALDEAKDGKAGAADAGAAATGGGKPVSAPSPTPVASLGGTAPASPGSLFDLVA